jgi:type I restriction enzyme S subunit
MKVWPKLQLRHLFKIYSGSTPESGNAEYWDGNIPWVTPEDISQLYQTNRVFDTKRKITEEGYKNSGVTLVPSNSIVLTKRAPIGLLAMLSISACSNQGCFLLVPKKEVIPEFYYYYLFANKSLLQILGRGSTFMELSLDDFKMLRVPSIPKVEQQSIVNYLDKELNYIDALIKVKEDLLTILSEKRQALINQAVTKGLNPNTIMKDSGVEWLGEVPEHWEIERSRWLFKERNERSETGEEEMLTVSHITGVTPRSDKDVNMFEAESNEGYKKCYPGDLVINTLWAWMGAMGVAPVEGIVSPAYHVYVPSTRIVSDYIDSIVRLPIFAKEVTRYSKGVWSSRLRLYPEGFFEVYLPVPPLEEQRSIIAFIKDELTKIDLLKKAAQSTIDLLKERRAALITAAVTGQIEIPADQ